MRAKVRVLQNSLSNYFHITALHAFRNLKKLNAKNEMCVLESLTVTKVEIHSKVEQIFYRNYVNASVFTLKRLFGADHQLLE